MVKYGFYTLLNNEVNRHKTIVLSELSLSDNMKKSISDNLADFKTEISFIDSLKCVNEETLQNKLVERFNFEKDYLSFLLITTSHEFNSITRNIFDKTKIGDFSRIEIPSVKDGYNSTH